MTEATPSPGAYRPETSFNLKEIEIPVRRVYAQKRLDRFLAGRIPAHSRTFWQKVIRDGSVTVNGRPAKPSYEVSSGDLIRLCYPEPVKARLLPEDLPIDVIYEDDAIIVINKSPGIVVHPAPGHMSGTLVNALLFHCEELSPHDDEQRTGVVHRLDKDTSGVILFAKKEDAHQYVAWQFEHRKVEKEYAAIVEGEVEFDSDLIDLSIARDLKNPLRMTVHEYGRDSVTEYEVIERFRSYTHLVARPKTGRTHQIRVHLAAIGHPVIGDATYGRSGDRLYLSQLLGRDVEPDEEPIISRQALHARSLTIRHPRTRLITQFIAPLPRDMREVLIHLRRHRRP
jgi:23S rRNA pseudouridine1911/1915/1917 synthase